MPQSVWLFLQSPPSGETRTSSVYSQNNKICVRWNPAFTSNEQAHLFKPVQVILIDLELKAFLEAPSLWHLHIHRTDVLLTLILLLLPQTAKATKWQFSGLVWTGDKKGCWAFYNDLFSYLSTISQCPLGYALPHTSKSLINGVWS